MVLPIGFYSSLLINLSLSVADLRCAAVGIVGEKPNMAVEIAHNGWAGQER
jgi:hypothetical protein